MLVCAIDGGFTNAGVAVIDTDAVPGTKPLVVAQDNPMQVGSTDAGTRFGKSRSRTDRFWGLDAHIGICAARWVATRAPTWHMDRVEVVLIESVQRHDIQKFGVSVAAAIEMWCATSNVPTPLILMRSGSHKFTGVNPAVADLYRSRLKGRTRYPQRKRCIQAFVRAAMPEASKDLHFDACDALVLAVVAIKEVCGAKHPWVKWMAGVEAGDWATPFLALGATPTAGRRKRKKRDADDTADPPPKRKRAKK